MPLGARVRALFGPWEPLVSDLWRSMFVDVAAWTGVIREWQPEPKRILEVGCGEGYSTAQLASSFPGVTIDAIDIAENIGRLYDGPEDAARFRIAYAEDLACEAPGSFDLIVLSDVLHHVPKAGRRSLLSAVRNLLATDGVLAFKDWHREITSPVHWAVHGSDRWLTGDRVHYLQRQEARMLVQEIFGQDAIKRETWIRPWRNNYAFCISHG